MPKETESNLGVDPGEADLRHESSWPAGPTANDLALVQPDVGLPEDWLLPAATDIARFHGGRAERASLQAKAKRLIRLGEDDEAAKTLAQLAQTDLDSHRNYAEAIDALSRSLELRFDAEIRDKLVQLLANCGNYSAAAMRLGQGPATALIDGQVRRRIATLYIRCGDSARAAAELTETARLEPEATDVLHAIGTIAYFAPEHVSRERGILAWHEAARRHRRKGALLPAFEAIMRAFELDPASSLAAERLAKELEAQGRREAADEVWRKSADAAQDFTRHDIRANTALESGDVLAALAALLDGRQDVTFDEQAIQRGVEQLLSPRAGLSQGFDMVLAEIGCADWLAVRLELGPLCERWLDEATAHTTLARLETSYFSHLEQAREAYVRAIAVQPAHAEARARLTSLSGEAPTDELLRALVQSARTAQDGVIARQLAGELFERCLRDGGPASLALWSLERLRYSSFKGEARERQLSVFRIQAEQEQSAITQLFVRANSALPDERITCLRDVEARLALDPTQTLEHLGVVRDILELVPTDSTLGSRLIELLDVVAGLVISPLRDERLAEALSTACRVLGERGRIAQARFYLRHGQLEPALRALLPLLEDENTTVRGLLWVLTLARRHRDVAASARAIERLALSFRPAIRAILEALCAQLYFESRRFEDAARVIVGAMLVSQNIARLVTLKVALAEHAEQGLTVEELERSLSRVMPNSSMCRAMAQTYRQASEFDLAYVWIQRAVSLRPGDLELRREALALALSLGNAERVTEVLLDLPKLALPVAGWVEAAASALAWLSSVEPASALQVAAQLLDAAGPSNRSLRAAMLSVSRLSASDEIALEILERAAAADESLAHRAEIQVALAERRLDRGELDASLTSTYLAAAAGAPVESWPRFDNEGLTLASGDARLAELELQRISANLASDGARLCATTRTLAVAKFDMAEDSDGAVALWSDFAQQPGAGGWPVAARDMVTVLGQEEALARLESLSRFGTTGDERGLLLLLAAQICDETGERARAAELLETAIQRVPTCVFAIPLAERLLGVEFEPQRLESIFASAERSVLGVHGARALHHRAAVAFASRELFERALTHACVAFESYPEHEQTFQVLARVARLAEQPHALVASVMRIAEAERNRERKVRWLQRAFEVLSDDPVELRLKFDLAIRILVGAPRVRAIRAVADCLSGLARLDSEEIGFMRERYVRALESLSVDLEGPDGARLGIAIAEAAIADLGNAALAGSGLLGAIRADADVDEFESLRGIIGEAVRVDLGAMRDVLSRALDWLERPYMAIGWPAVEVLAILAMRVHDTSALLRLERRSIALGHKPWLVPWLSAENLGIWAENGDPKVLATELGRSLLESGDAAQALEMLERGAEFSRHELGDDDTSKNEGSYARASWLEWQNVCSRCLEFQLPIVGILSLRERIAALEPRVPPAVVAALRVTIERSGDDPRALSAALAELAFCGNSTGGQRSALLIEAAEIAEHLGDFEGAVAYYRASVATSRGAVHGKIGLCSLLYRLGRCRSKEQAEFIVEMTDGLELSTSEEDRELSVYLRAEAMSTLGMHRESNQLLLDAELRLGPRTFVVLGLAERAVREQTPDVALGYFAAAMGGNLRNLRRMSDVALAAARAAAATGDVALAITWLEPALQDPSTKPDAMTLHAELLGAADVLTANREQAETSASAWDLEPPGVDAGADAGALVGVLEAAPLSASALGATVTRERWAIEERELASENAIFGPGDEDRQKHSIEDVLAQHREAATECVPEGDKGELVAVNGSAVESATIPISVPAPPPASALQATTDLLVTSRADWSRSAANAASGYELSNDLLPIPQVPVMADGLEIAPKSSNAQSERAERDGRASAFVEVSSAVDVDRIDVAEPSAVEFAVGVAEELAMDPDRLRAWLPDGRRWLRQWPTQLRLIELVQRASEIEGRTSHVSALEQVASVLRGESQNPAAPDFGEQPVDIDAVKALLQRDLVTAGAEALELIWDGAEHEFLREPGDYEVTGLMRVVGTTSAIARIHGEAARHFGMTRTPLFHRRTVQESRISVLLLNPIALLLEGDPTPEEDVFAYRIGSALWATQPGNALLFGLGRDTVRQVFKALGLAFGTGGGQPNPTYGESLRLAQVLWQTVKSRSQRRLKEICQTDLDFEQSFQKSSQSLRRAGFYVSGDLRQALRAVCEEVARMEVASDPKKLVATSVRLPEAMDLFRFATSAEYADVRWQPGRFNQPGGGTRPW